MLFKLFVIFFLSTQSTLANKITIHHVAVTPRTIAYPLAISELRNEIKNHSLPWNSFLPDEAEQQSRVFSEGKFRRAGFGSGAFVVGPPKRLVFGNNDTYRNTPLTPLRENYMNCSFRKHNPKIYDEALYPFENIDEKATKTVLVVCDNSVHGTNMCEFLKVLYNADSAHCTCPHVMDGYANVGFCTLRYRDGKEMSYCNTPAHKPIWLLRLCAYKIPVSTQS